MSQETGVLKKADQVYLKSNVKITTACWDTCMFGLCRWSPRWLVPCEPVSVLRKWQNDADFSFIHCLQIPLLNQNQHLFIKLLLFMDSVSVNLQLYRHTNISEMDTSNTTDFYHCRTTGRKWRLFVPNIAMKHYKIPVRMKTWQYVQHHSILLHQLKKNDSCTSTELISVHASICWDKNATICQLLNYASTENS